MKKILLILVLCIFLIGCQKQAPECQSPQVKLNGNCCLDSNNNQFCDDSEPKEVNEPTEPEEVKPQEPVPPIQPSEPNEELPEEPEELTPIEDQESLEKGIFDAYYPLYRYEFSDDFRFNVSGFDASYDVRKADRFSILSLEVIDDFSKFTKEKYQNAVVKNEMYAPELILKKNYDERWKGASFEYSHELLEEDDSFIEKQLLIFKNGADALEAEFSYNAYVQCMEGVIVQIAPLEKWDFDYSAKYAAATVNKEVAAYISNQKPRLLEDVSIIQRICSGEKVESGIEKGTIELYSDKFVPELTTIKVGDALKIENNMNSNVVVIFTREQPRKQFASQLIAKGTTWEMVLDEPGKYSYFINGFNPKGYVEVS